MHLAHQRKRSAAVAKELVVDIKREDIRNFPVSSQHRFN